MKIYYAMIVALLIISFFVPAISYHQQTMEDAQDKIQRQRQIMVEIQKDNSLMNNPSEQNNIEKPKYSHYPVARSVITSHFGYRKNPMGGGFGYTRLHKGVDMIGALNSPVRSVTNGEVVEHWPPPDGYYNGHPVFGGLLVIEFDDRFYIYGHLKETFVDEGDTVDRGQKIGIMGATGIATGPHLHFEVSVNPMNYINQ